MHSLPIQYLYLETGIIAIFLGVTILMQLARASEAAYFVSKSRSQMFWVVGGFGFLVLGLGAALSGVSPLFGAELAAGIILSLLHPVNALCFFVHLLYLRPWEIVTTHPILLALPRGIALLCFFSWLLHPGQHSKPNPRTLRSLHLLLFFSAWLFLSTFFTPEAAQNRCRARL